MKATADADQNLSGRKVGKTGKSMAFVPNKPGVTARGRAGGKAKVKARTGGPLRMKK